MSVDSETPVKQLPRDPTKIRRINSIYHRFPIKYPVNVLPDTLARQRDFRNVCRICANTVDDVLLLFTNEGEKFDIVTKINKHLPIKVKESDFMPQGICETCAIMVLSWHELVRTSQIVDLMLRRRLKPDEPYEPPPNPSESAGTESTKNGIKWKLYVGLGNSDETLSESVPNFSSYKDHDTDHHECHDVGPHLSRNAESELLSDSRSAAEDDVPLSDIVSAKSKTLYNNFYEAVVNFRNHLVNEHESRECSYPDFTDSNNSGSDDNETDEPDANGYDDLTQSNMRKDRMDEETRLELSQARIKLDGKVYYACKACGKKLSSSHTYLFHKRIHTGERPCVCHVCGKQFRAPGGLQRHLTETHERLRRYTCNLCPKTFVNLQNLKQHFRIHTGERPFECSQCGKRFTQSGSLHVHSKTHSERFPHECTECGAKFRLRSGLTRHRLKHTGERPHVCTHCGKGYRQRHELNSHVLFHSNTKPYTCPACGAAFRQRKALRHHCRRAHQNPVPTATTVGDITEQLSYNHVQSY